MRALLARGPRATHRRSPPCRRLDGWATELMHLDGGKLLRHLSIADAPAGQSVYSLVSGWLLAHAKQVYAQAGGAPAYDAIDMELSDFDLVYGFPWPDEHDFFRAIMKQCARPDALFLSYDARDKISLCRVNAL